MCVFFLYYHWNGTSGGGPLIPAGITYQLVSAYLLKWFVRYMYDEIKQITTWRALKKAINPNDHQNSDHNIFIDVCFTASER